MSPPTQRLEKLVIDRQIVHPASPVLDYCIGNVVCEMNSAGNVKPSNKLRRREDKIDGAVALIMALGVAMAEEPVVPIMDASEEGGHPQLSASITSV